MARESAAERNARILAETYEGDYGDLTISELEGKVIFLLDEVDDLSEQRKAHMDSFKELVDDKLSAIKYCRERRHYLRGANLEDQATQLLNDNE